jgi:carbon storage regulator
VVIGGGISVAVLEVDGNRLRLGIEAPEDVRVLRGELAWWQEDSPCDEPAISACLSGA